MRPFLAAGLAALAISATVTDTAYSQPRPDDTLLVAQSLIERGRPELACPLLRVTLDQAAPDPDALFLLGRCSRDIGLIDDAVRYYEQGLALRPEAPQPRTELAALYVVQGRTAEARQQLDRVAASGQSVEVTSVLRGMLRQLSLDDPAALAAQTPKRWAVDAFVGLVRDTNVNVGPSASTVAAVVGGVPIDLTLSPDARPRASWGATANIGGRYLAPLNDRYALLFQGSLSKTEYFSEPDFDTDGMALATALIFRDGGFSANLQPNIRWARQDNDLQEMTYGITGRATQQFADGWSATASTGWFNRSVPPSEPKDADGFLGSAGIGKRLAGGQQIIGEYLVQREIAERAYESRTMHGPSLLFVLPLSETVEAVANYRYTSIDYDARQALFATAREDDQHTVGLTALWDVSQWLGHNIGLRAQYAYTRNQSNLALYDYDRHTMLFGVQTRF